MLFLLEVYFRLKLVQTIYSSVCVPLSLCRFTSQILYRFVNLTLVLISLTSEIVIIVVIMITFIYIVIVSIIMIVVLIMGIKACIIISSLCCLTFHHISWGSNMIFSYLIWKLWSSWSIAILRWLISLERCHWLFIFDCFIINLS